MFKKINFKNLLIIYFNLIVISVISILIIFIIRGVDPKEDPHVVDSYLNNLNLYIAPFQKDLDNLWVTGEILQTVEGIRNFLKMPEEELTKKGIPNLQNRITRILTMLTDLNNSTIPVFANFSIIGKNEKSILRFALNEQTGKSEFQIKSDIPLEIKEFIADYKKDQSPTSREFLRLKFLPPDLRVYLTMIPIWEGDEFLGVVILGNTVKENIRTLFFPEKSDKKSSIFLIDEKMRTLKGEELQKSIFDFFPEIPHGFISGKENIFWDKKENLYLKTKFLSMFNGGRTWVALQRIPKKIVTAHLDLFKKKLITLSLFLLVVVTVLAFFVISKGFKPLRKIVIDLNGAAKIIKKSSLVLNDTSTSWAESSMESSTGIETIVNSMDGFLKTFGEIKEETEKADIISKKGNALANSIRIEMEKLLASIKEISTTSKKIEDINKIIGEISFQTNLLALNASVEAARAGEHGRGFAIVAESIRELADKTAQSTDEISRLILDAWTKSQKGSRAANNSHEIINEVITNIKETRSVVENINNSILGQFEQIGPVKNGLSIIQNTVKSGTSNAIKGNEISVGLNSQTIKLTEIVTNLSETIVGEIN
jgi:predicted  nucleic acid-binding Zn-ribbon protein